MCGFLIAVAALLVERGLWGVQTSVAAEHGLSSCGSRAPEYSLSSGGTQAGLGVLGHVEGIFPDQKSNPCSLHW